MTAIGFRCDEEPIQAREKKKKKKTALNKIATKTQCKIRYNT